ncbi:heterokaryon incompatibility protein-domain-containing protein, partial [Cadophora sp. MPI-SDFR-AT-0126]
MLHAANQIRNTLEQRNTYCYKNIDYNNQIRVLKIFPGRPGTPIHCCLIPCKLFEQTANSSLKISDSVPYAALSYFWGNDEPEEEIRVFATEGGYYEWRKKDMRGVMLQTTMVSCLLIRTNLHNALQQLRSEKDPVVLWADALCINQRNVLERTAQVSRMHDVYTQAERVCIWLGKGKEPDNKRTFEFLNKILDLYELEQVVQRLKDKKADSTWLDDKLDCKKTLDLMGAEWFRRRWVIQELALARSAFVLFGSQEMPWLDFADAIALFMTKFDQIKLAFPASTDYVVSRQSNDNYIKSLDARALGANVLVTATSNLFRKSSSGQVIQRLLSLELLVSSMLLVFEATDPRDTVFAVLQIAKDISTHHRHTRLRACRGSLQSYAPYMLVITLIVWLLSRMLVKAIFGDVASSKSKCKIDKRIEANYRKCLRDVCADFIEYCIEDSKSLDIICRHWAPIPKPSALSPQMQMPSWILPIGGNAFGRPDQVRKGRVNGDSFVGPEKGGYYTASGTLTPQIEFG